VVNLALVPFQGQFLEGVGTQLFLRFPGRFFGFPRVRSVGEQSPCFFTLFSCLTQADFGVGAKCKQFFLVGKPVLEAPELAAGCRDKQIEASAISQFGVFFFGPLFVDLDVG
jgi:hypothetical protein